MKWAPTSACEIDSNLEPLELRRKKAALELYERSKRLERNHINRTLVDQWKKKDKQNSVLQKVKALKDKHHLTETREPKHWIHTNTDGSAFKATINSGYRATVDYPDGTKT